MCGIYKAYNNTIEKLDGVGPVDNRRMTCDTRHVTYGGR